MQLSNNQQAFLALVRAGLWEKEVQLASFGQIDFNEVYRLAEEQSVVGLVAAGIEHIVDVKVPQEVALQFASIALQIEHRNEELDTFIVKLVSRLRGKEIFGLIVKGQGVAQCYERPKWRASGDVDLLLDEENYEKAKSCLIPIAYDVKEEACEAMHQELSIMGVVVELHGKMPFGMSKKADRIIGNVINESLHTGAVNAWRIDNTDVFIPNPDNHVLLVFTHYLRHFFIEGVGLRQICDWCRIIWSYSKIINVTLLEKRLHSMGLTSEWKTFSALAVNTLGIPQDTMPLFDITYRKRGERVLNNVLKRGNFGHNNDLSYRVKYKGFAYNIVSLWRRMCDFAGFTLIFPLDAPRFFFSYLFNKVK